jgi:hypothetical protein
VPLPAAQKLYLPVLAATLDLEEDSMRSDPRGGTGGTWREGADKFGLRSSSRRKDWIAARRSGKFAAS